MTQQEVTCQTCQGKGLFIHPNDRCKICKGQKVISEENLIFVHIERGMKDDDHIVVKRISDEAPGSETGDLIVLIHEKKYDSFPQQNPKLLINQKNPLNNHSSDIIDRNFCFLK